MPIQQTFSIGSPTTTSPQLNSIRDWPRFINALKGFSSSRGIWEHIDPEASPRKPWREQPKVPDTPAILSGPEFPFNAPVIQDEDWEATVKKDTEEKARRAKMTPRQRSRLDKTDPIPTRLRASTHQNQLTLYSKSLEAAKIYFNAEIGLYWIKMDQFRTECEDRKQVQNWIRMHISPAVAIQIHIEAEYLPDSTVDKLMKALKVTDTNLAFAAPQIFGEAMRKLSVFPPDNDVAQWISEWCVDIKFCQQKNLSQATNTRQVWSAITANLPKNLAEWGMMYMGRHAQQMALGHLDIEDVASNITAWHEQSRCETDSNLPFTSAVEGGPKKNGRKGKSAGNRCPFCKEKHSPNKCRLWVQANRYKSYKVDKRRLDYVAKSVTVPGHPLAVELAKVAATGGFIVDPEMAKDKYSAAASKDDPSESLEALMEEVNARVRKRLAQKCGKD